MDGTFNQHRPLDYLVGSNVSYCFDLKSATDRWPLPLLNTMAQLLLGNLRGKTLVEVCLGSNEFYVGPPLTKREFEPISFKVGQLLGYLTPWPLFSLCHHFLVWLVARLAYPKAGQPFHGYAIVGYDIVITDSLVASEYRRILDQLGVNHLSPMKSLISKTGSLEFAKRFRVARGTKDFSPVSLRPALLTRLPF